MKIIRINEVWFRGQYAEAVDYLLEGHSLDISDFNNGTYEATTQIQKFMSLLDEAKIAYDVETNARGSIRSTIIHDGGTPKYSLDIIE